MCDNLWLNLRCWIVCIVSERRRFDYEPHVLQGNILFHGIDVLTGNVAVPKYRCFGLATNQSSFSREKTDIWIAIISVTYQSIDKLFEYYESHTSFHVSAYFFSVTFLIEVRYLLTKIAVCQSFEKILTLRIDAIGSASEVSCVFNLKSKS